MKNLEQHLKSRLVKIAKVIDDTKIHTQNNGDKGNFLNELSSLIDSENINGVKQMFKKLKLTSINSGGINPIDIDSKFKSSTYIERVDICIAIFETNVTRIHKMVNEIKPYLDELKNDLTINTKRKENYMGEFLQYLDKVILSQINGKSSIKIGNYTDIMGTFLKFVRDESKYIGEDYSKDSTLVDNASKIIKAILIFLYLPYRYIRYKNDISPNLFPRLYREKIENKLNIVHDTISREMSIKNLSPVPLLRNIEADKSVSDFELKT